MCHFINKCIFFLLIHAYNHLKTNCFWRTCTILDLGDQHLKMINWFQVWQISHRILQPPAVRPPILPETSPLVGMKRVYAPSALRPHSSNYKTRQEERRKKMLSSQFSLDKSAKPRIKSAPRYCFFYSVLLLFTKWISVLMKRTWFSLKCTCMTGVFIPTKLSYVTILCINMCWRF